MTSHLQNHGGNTRTFSMLFRMVLTSTPPIFSFILLFTNFTKMTQCYWPNGSKTFKEPVSVTESTNVREPISVAYQCGLPARCENNLLVHLAGAHGPDSMLKLMSRRGRIDGARGTDLAHGPDFAVCRSKQSFPDNYKEKTRCSELT